MPLWLWIFFGREWRLLESVLFFWTGRAAANVPSGAADVKRNSNSRTRGLLDGSLVVELFHFMPHTVDAFLRVQDSSRSAVKKLNTGLWKFVK